MEAKTVAIQVLKRLTVLLIELATEALLLGLVFWLCLLIFANSESSRSLRSSLASPAIAALPVVLMMFVSGYYFTRPILGLIWKKDPVWQYATAAAVFFAVHECIAFVRFKPDLSKQAIAIQPWFLAGGCLVVFCCAMLGRRCLQLWNRPRKALTQTSDLNPQNASATGHGSIDL